MVNDNIEKVFLRAREFRVTNKNVTYIQKKSLSKDNVETWDADSIKSIHEVVIGAFLIKRAVFYLLIIFTVFTLNTANFQEYIAALQLSSDLHLFKDYQLTLGEDKFGTRTFILLAYSLTFISVLVVWILHQILLGHQRYLSIKFKDDKERRIPSTMGSLVGVEESWDKAVAFGILPNNSTESHLATTLNTKYLEITHDSFSIPIMDKKINKTETPGLRDAISSLKLSLSPPIVEWKAFKLSKISKITVVDVISPTLISVIGGLVMLIPIGISTQRMPSFLYFENRGDPVSMTSLAIFGLVWIVFMSVIYFGSRSDRSIEIELNDGEVLKITADINWQGESMAKQALDEALKKNLQITL